MSPQQLPLQDVRLPPAPSWWPPAPGWWWLALPVLLAVLVALGWWVWRGLRRRRWQRLFDRELASARGDAESLALMSGLLRRAARRVDPTADRLHGEAWLRWLDGERDQAFSAGPGRVLLDGAFRPAPQVVALPALIALVRARFVSLMAGRR